MKQKLLAVFTVLALCFSMTACHVSTPSTVGQVGDVEITSGIYLISQFQAYQTVLGFGNSTQTALSTSAFLKETVYVAEDGTVAPAPAEGEAQTGEARLVSDFVTTETMKNLEYYAAVETLFAQLGGELTEAELATADSYADQLWASYGELYQQNGIGEETLRTYQYSTMKQNALLNLLYGTDGTEAVSDASLTTYLQDDMVYGHYLSIPLYNTADYTFADADKQAEIFAVLDEIATEFNDTMAQDPEADATETLLGLLGSDVGAAYDVTGSMFDAATVSDSLVSDLFGNSTLEEYFEEDALAAVTALDYNQATAIQADYTSAMIFMRSDPMAQELTLDDLRVAILADMKTTEMVDLIKETGLGLTHTLDTGAMAKFPAKKVVNQ